MPSIFKALATITAWILFVLGCILVLAGLVIPALGGQLFVVGVTAPLPVFAGLGVAVVTLILAVCAMKLRQMLP
jgi:hypothetical protein